MVDSDSVSWPTLWGNDETARLLTLLGSAAVARPVVRLNLDVIVTAATSAAEAAHKATATVPIVIIDPGDPIEAGLVTSLARPGGNITGQSSIAPELASKRLQLLKETAPSITRVALLWNSAIPPLRWH